jgi:glucose-6-phosphate isomerase/transaldolase/glucose-6-phosphate isomerase
MVEREIGEDSAGANFIAVTDPGTPLEELGKREGFRRVFANQPDIGGRYSVLSYFGLVPAALTGIDVGELLKRADEMAQHRAVESSVAGNPGLHLGAIMGSLAKEGRDKLTLFMSPSIGSFGLWVEQLIAESTGKEGTGIVPIADEPVLSPEQYGDDRVFVFLRVDDDDNDELDSRIDDLRDTGHPVVVIRMHDIFDLGAEFFRWEFATVVAGAILGIQPFDQPDVQAAKDATNAVLEDFKMSGISPDVRPTGTVDELLAQTRPGDYLAIMAYVEQTLESDEALAVLRQTVVERYKVATTFGYGPRFLHSTGQLHKGGPHSGLFLQITSKHADDIEIPGERFSFGNLADAQAAGDFQALRSLGRRVVRVDASSIPGLTLSIDD